MGLNTRMLERIGKRYVNSVQRHHHASMRTGVTGHNDKWRRKKESYRCGPGCICSVYKCDRRDSYHQRSRGEDQAGKPSTDIKKLSQTESIDLSICYGPKGEIGVRAPKHVLENCGDHQQGIVLFGDPVKLEVKL